MGCFNFDCPNCGAGTQRDEDGGEWDERDYFGAAVRIKVPTKKGKSVILEGKYTGYGEVEVEFGDKTETFYPKQFEEYWDCWGPVDQFVSESIYCEECMEDYTLTSRAEFDLGDFTLVKDYMAEMEAPKTSMAPWNGPSKWGVATAAPPPPVVATPPAAVAPVVVATAKPKKAPKPKAPTKEELAKKVAEMTAELERLRPLEARFKTLEAENVRMREALRAKNERLDMIRKAVNGY